MSLEKIIWILICGSLGLAIAFFCYTIVGTDYQNINVRDNAVLELREWESSEDGKNTSHTLPMAFRNKEADPYYEISYDLGQLPEMEGTISALLSLKYCDLEVFIGETRIFKSELPETKVTDSVGVQYLMVNLGTWESWKDQTLILRYTPLLGDTLKYEISVPLIGRSEDIIAQLLKTDLIDILLEMTLILVGIILFAADLLLRKSKEYVLHYAPLGQFSLFCGCYLVCQLTTVHLFAGNPYIIYYLEFLALPGLIISLVFVLKELVTGVLQKMYQVMLILFLVIITGEGILNFFFNVEFRKTLLLTHFMIGVLLAGIIITLLRGRELQEDAKKDIIISVFPVVVGGLVDTALYYVLVLDTATIFFKLGLWMFIVLQAVFISRKYKESYHKRLKADLYQELAYHDSLTGLLNRLALREEKTKIAAKSEGAVACISLDVNNLKVVNDASGHEAGDQLLCGMAGIMKNCVRDNEMIYRIGGDEFLILMPGSSKARMEDLKEQLRREAMHYNLSAAEPVEFAMGAVWRDTADEAALDEMIFEADKVMYQMKNQMKSQR